MSLFRVSYVPVTVHHDYAPTRFLSFSLRFSAARRARDVAELRCIKHCVIEQRRLLLSSTTEKKRSAGWMMCFARFTPVTRPGNSVILPRD